MKDEISISRMIALLKKQFPPIERDFYKKFRKRMEELDREIEGAEYERKDELIKERENLMLYGERVYRKRMRSLLVTLSKKLSGGKTEVLNFTDEEMEIFNTIHDLIEQKKKELLEGQVNILEKSPVLFEESEEGNEPEKMPENIEEKEVETPQEVEKHGEKEGVNFFELEERAVEDVEKENKGEEKRDIKRERTIPVRMLSEKPFVGLDGHYYYPEKGDILNLNEKMANILIEGGYAERVESR